jgi:hypothetical protein
MKRVTINELAEMVRDGFLDNDRRFDQIEGKIDQILGIQNSHENRISNLEDNMRIIKRKFE